MESKGNNDWSDKESDSSEDKASREKARQAADETEQAPEPDLKRGTIYERESGPLSLPRPIFQEWEPGKPETARGIWPGSPEVPQVEKTAPTAAEQARMHQEQMTAHAETTDQEDDDGEEDDGKGKDEDKERSGEDTEEPVEAHIPEEDTTPAEPTPIQSLIQGQPAASPPQPVEVNSEPPQPPAEKPLQPVADQSPRFVPPAEAIPPAAIPGQEQETSDEWRQTAAGQPPGSIPPHAAAGNLPPAPPPPEQPIHPGNYPPEPEGWRWQQGANAAPRPDTHGFNTAPAHASQPATAEYRNVSPDRQRQKSVAPWVLTAALAGYLFGRHKVKPLEKQVSTQQAKIDQLREKIAQFERQPAPSMQTAEHQDHMHAGAPEAAYTPLQPSETYPSILMPQAKVPGQQSEFSQGRTQPQPRPEIQQPTATAPERQPHVVIGEDGQQIVLQPGQRLVRGEGGYAEIVDEYNRVVQNAIQHGESYYQDQAPERQPTPFGSKDARFRTGVTAPLAGDAGGAAPASPQLGAGQAPADHSLPANSAGQSPAEEAQHLLNAPKPNPAVSAITSPWLWLAVGILMIAFFAAATI